MATPKTRPIGNTESYNKLHQIAQEQIQKLTTELSVAVTRIDNLYRRDKVIAKLFTEIAVENKKLKEHVDFLESLALDREVPRQILGGKDENGNDYKLRMGWIRATDGNISS